MPRAPRLKVKKQYVVEHILTVAPKKVSVAYKGKTYEYDYGQVSLVVPPELVGKKVKVIATLIEVD